MLQMDISRGLNIPGERYLDETDDMQHKRAILQFAGASQHTYSDQEVR